MTFEGVLTVFDDYLAEDDSCEVLHTSRGYLVIDWGSEKNDWVTTSLCRTPERLRDMLRSCYEEYQIFLLTQGGKRDVTMQEEQEIHNKGAVLAEKISL